MANIRRNRDQIPSGMLAPNGYAAGMANPAVQATTRPPGTLLMPSPGYDSVREGKNVFQGKGPTGGFRPLRYAEDVGGTGATVSIEPGTVADLPNSEFLDTQGFPGGPALIADRKLDPGFAGMLHEGLNTLPDMGDRTPDRPLTKSMATWVSHPFKSFQSSYRQNPAMALLGAVGFLVVATYVVDDVEKAWRGRGRGVTGAAEAGTAASGDIATDSVKKITDTTEKAIDTLENATNKAVEAISDAGKDAVSAIKSTTT